MTSTFNIYNTKTFIYLRFILELLMVEYSNIGKKHLMKTFKRMNDAYPCSFTQKKSAKCF